MNRTKATTAFFFSILALHASAALQIHWDVELTAQPPQIFTLQRPRGETYELEAVLKNRGKPFEPAITNACIYWQTNGMENLYWSAPASVSNNFLRASWLPSMDPGATTVRGYIGDPGHIYAAAFQFRFIASPGELPNVLPLPVPVIDFAKVTVLNPPWSGGGGGGVDTNAVREIAQEEISLATNGIPEQIAGHIPTAISNATGRIDADLTVTKVETYADWTPNEVIITPHEKYTVLDFITYREWHALHWLRHYEESEWEIDIDYPMSGDIYNPDATELIFPDGTKTYRRRTVTTKLATTNDVNGAISEAISTNNPAFVSAVRSVSPAPSANLRVFDAVRQCWWIGTMVNGVINWEVE